MQCMACGRETQFIANKMGIEAAFCHYHYPLLYKRINFVMTVTVHNF